MECHYCNKSFKSKYYLEKKHSYKCPSREDPVRILEIKLNVKPDEVQPNQCRFCTKVLCNNKSLTRHIKTCKKHKEYLQGLIDSDTKPVGQESLTHFNTEQVIDILRQIRNNKSITDIHKVASTWINRFGKLIRSVPQNQNYRVNTRSGLIFNGSQWIRSTINDTLNTVISNDSRTLIQQRDSIQNVNERVFNNQINNRVFDQVQTINNYSSKITASDMRFIRNLYKYDTHELSDTSDF